MSLDVYLRLRGETTPGGSGIFVRENGTTREISREEWDRAFPGREPVVVADDDEEDEVYSRNITHNLNTMASEAGVYDALWRPYRVADPERSRRVAELEAAHQYHGPDGAYALENSITVRAHVLIEPLRAGLELLRADPERFKKHNPENGWGDYYGLCDFVEEYLAACERWPSATVEISR